MFRQQQGRSTSKAWVLLAGAALFAFTSIPGWSQNPHTQHTDSQATTDQSLADQVQQLREQINQLQQTVQQQGTQRSSPAASPAVRSQASPAMGGGMPAAPMSGEMAGMPMSEMAGMPMQEMGKMMQEMGKPMQEMGMNMQQAGMNMEKMGMNMEKRGMGEMGGMTGSSSTASGAGAMGNMSAAPQATRQTASRSVLPGFPGASHLYHIGSTGFFLDHPSHISLTSDQQARLNRIKEKATLDNTAAQRRIDEGEQKLWTLTAADQPDQAAIAAQAKAIEGLRTDQRLAYIRAVGEAAQVLTEQQRQALLGSPMKPGK